MVRGRQSAVGTERCVSSSCLEERFLEPLAPEPSRRAIMDPKRLDELLWRCKAMGLPKETLGGWFAIL